MALNQTARLADQIVAAAYSAGFRGQALVDWTAIALAESRGNINARGDTTITNSTWGASVGLWQVRSMHSHRGRWDGSNYVRDASRLTDPMVNARAAWIISNGGKNKRPWSVTHEGKPNSYKRFLNVANNAVARTTQGGGRTLNRAGQFVLNRMRAGDYVGGVVPSSAANPVQGAANSGTLRLGNRGARVKALQERLNRFAGISITVDGIYGNETRSAVRFYQRKNGMLTDGIAGPSTLGKLGLAQQATSGWENRVGGVQGSTSITQGDQGVPSGPAVISGLGGSPVSGGGGITGGGGGGLGSGRPLSPSELREYIAETYPQMLWALDHEELGPILKSAAEEGWSAGRMYGKLVQTNWWQSNPESERALQQVIHNDPATWRQMISEKHYDLRSMIRSVGAGAVSGKQQRELAEQAIRQGWSDNRLREELLRTFAPTMGALEQGRGRGQAQQIFTSIQDMPNEYLMKLPRRDIYDWAMKIVNGNATVESFQQYLEQSAQAQMPFLETFIKQGITPRQALAPQRAQVANVLELDEEGIDFAEGKWQGLLTDDKGQLASSVQVRQFARERMPTIWDKTTQARSSAAQLTQDLAGMFGSRA